MPKYTNLKIAAFEKQLISDENAVILDVRTPAEFASGHLEGAINAPNIKNIVHSLNPNKHYYVHCRIGGRSAVAAYVLALGGFQYVFNLSDSLANTTLPLLKETSVKTQN